MPNFDGTGPLGKGPMTGRGLGPCAKSRKGSGADSGLGLCGKPRGTGTGLGRTRGRGRGAVRGRNA